MDAIVLVVQLLTGRSFSSVPVLVTVGEAKQHFYVHEPLLRASSQFFDAALNKQWQEGQTRVVDLPESDPETFKIYANWLYSGTLLVDDELAVPAAEKDIWDLMVKAYILGDRLCDKDFKDAVTDGAAQECLREYEGETFAIGPEPCRWLFGNSTPGVSFRRLIVRYLAAFVDLSIIKEDEPSALLHAIIQEMNRDDRPTEEEFAAEVEACSYHEHKAGAENCYRNKRR